MQNRNSLIRSIIFGVLLLIVIFGFNYRLNVIEDEIVEMKQQDTLVLLQIRDTEKDVKQVQKQVTNIDGLIDKYSKQFGVDPDLAHSVAKVESGKRQVVSRSGIGVFQLQPVTAKSMGVNPYNTEDNIKGAIKYLAYLDKKYNGNEDLILAGYNAGEGNVKKHGGVPPYTRGYINKVKTVKASR